MNRQGLKSRSSMPGVIRTFATLFLTNPLWSFGATASGEVELYIEGSDKFGRLERVVRPEFPAEALERGESGVILVSGVVDGTGLLTDVRLEPASGVADAFVSQVKKVVPYWIFRPKIGANCLPTDERVEVKVEFEIDAGKPRIFLTQAPGIKWKSARSVASLMPIHMMKPWYPGSQYRNLEARVFARQDIDANGEVVEVATAAYLRPFVQAPNLAFDWIERRLAQYRELDGAGFADQVHGALSKWRFEPSDVPLRRRCSEVVFSLVP